jgi:hypothetical protein
VKLEAAEQLRQERETFELNKRQAAQWFGLRLRMGYCGLVILIALAASCMFMILSAKNYPIVVVDWAATVLAGDIFALVIAAWKLVLNPNSAINLNPVTKTSICQVDRASGSHPRLPSISS